MNPENDSTDPSLMASGPEASSRAPDGAQQSAGWGALLAGANGVRSVALAGGVALHAINVYIATTMLPSVVRDIGGLDLYAWSTTIFVVASILGSALSTRLLQRAGPRAAYVIASAVFIIGSIGCALAPSMPIMLVGRFIQGMGGGFLIALAYAMIRLVFDETLWPRAMALVSGMWGVATLVGPAIGGIFAQLGVWRAAFWTLVPIAILFSVLTFAVLPARQAGPPQSARLPVAQLALLTCIVLAISAGSVSPVLLWNVAGIAVACGLAALLVLTERRARQKLLPTGAFRPGSTLAAIYLTMGLLAIVVTSGEVFAPLFLQILHLQSPLAAGYLTALMAAGWTTGSIISSGAAGRGIGRAIVAGPILQLSATAALFVLMPQVSGGGWFSLVPICIALFVVGLGVGTAWPHLLTRVLKVAPADEQDLAGGSITTIQLLAVAIGAALAGMVANAGGLIDPGGVSGTQQAARWLFGVFTLAALCCALASRRAARG